MDGCLPLPMIVRHFSRTIFMSELVFKGGGGSRFVSVYNVDSCGPLKADFSPWAWS